MEHHYLLQSSDAGAARLSVLASVHQAATEQLFDRLELPSAPACLDLGCGAGAVTRLIAARFTRDGGTVRGVDIDPHYIALAKSVAATAEASIDYLVGSAYDVPFHHEYDLVYSRFLLSHLDNPHKALEQMIRAAKPGGIIALEDVDFGGAFCDPPSPDFERYLLWYDRMTRQNGGNPNLGRSLFGLATRVGLADLSFAIDQPSFATGPGKELATTTLDHIGQALLTKGIATSDEISRTLAGLKNYVADATTILSMPRIFQVWGRVTKPIG